MNALKLTLAASVIASAAIASILAADGSQTPAATPHEHSQEAASCHLEGRTANQRTRPVVGSPKDLSNSPAIVLAGSKADAQGCCAKMKTEPAKKGCCK